MTALPGAPPGNGAGAPREGAGGVEAAGGGYDVAIIDDAAGPAAEAAPFQVMPALSAEEYEALRADVAERGVLVPVLVDQHGRVLDGHHRQAIAAELGIDCPTEICHVDGDDEARDVALTLNVTRRHLTREQKRALVAAEITTRPDDSDRAIARRLGCSPSTVGAVRRGEVSNLDTDPEPFTAADRQRAETLTEEIRVSLHQYDHDVVVGLLRGVPPAMLARCLLEILSRVEHEIDDREVTDPIRRHIGMPRVDAILAWPHGGYYADEVDSMDDELRAVLHAQRERFGGGRDG